MVGLDSLDLATNGSRRPFRSPIPPLEREISRGPKHTKSYVFFTTPYYLRVRAREEFAHSTNLH